MKTLDQLLTHFAAQGCTFKVYYDHPDDPDYNGPDTGAALEALTACDVMQMLVLNENDYSLGWCMIVNEFNQDPEDQIADHSATGEVAEFLS